MSKKGLIVIISAPSGSGKTSICHALKNKHPDIEFSISATTRPPRKNEINNQDYIFISQEEFQRKIQEGYFAEWAKVYDHYYGTPVEFLIKCLDQGKVCLLDIDVQGGLAIKKKFPQAVSIFITLPGVKEIEKRLRGRDTESEAIIQSRMLHFKKELKYQKKYDYTVVNDKIDNAVKKIIEIINKKY